MSKLSRERLIDVLKYDPATGIFTWVKPTGRRAHVGDVAGCTRRGYRGIRIDTHCYPAHVLAWFYMNNEWPSCDIDHINGDRADNRWSNLRLATRSQNKMNVGKTRANTSGFKGVTWDKSRNKWKAQIEVNGRHIGLGRFDDPKIAHLAYVVAARKLFGEFARTA